MDCVKCEKADWGPVSMSGNIGFVVGDQMGILKVWMCQTCGSLRMCTKNEEAAWVEALGFRASHAVRSDAMTLQPMGPPPAPPPGTGGGHILRPRGT